MKEFGSDFHTQKKYYDTGKADITRIIRNANYLADGRQGLILVVRQEGWKRLWVPEYFCYEVLEAVEKCTDVKLMYYVDFPGVDSHERLKTMPFEEGDALLRMNYFGLIEYHKEKSFPIPVVEDHSHDLLGRWALFSDADWCVASLRKTLPLAEGGIVWSPKGMRIEKEIGLTRENELIAQKRWNAMDLKAKYLSAQCPSAEEKDEFRSLYVETEEKFDSLDLSLIDERGMCELEQFDINSWYNQKKKNWHVLVSLLDKGIRYLCANDDSCTPFSLVLRCEDNVQREKVRMGLIRNAVYPAVLWRVPDCCSDEVKNMSDCLLSVHCDGRYSVDDMKDLADRINMIYRGL